MVNYLTKSTIKYDEHVNCYVDSESGIKYPYPGFTQVNRGTTQPISEAPSEKLKRLTQLGIEFHELLLNGIPPGNYSPEIEKLIKSYTPFAKKSKIIAQEVFITDSFDDQVGKPLKLIGFIDAIATYEGQLMLLDWKTKQSSRFDKRTLEKAYMQICLYYRMFVRFYKQVPEGLGILTIFSSGEPAKLYQIEKGSINGYLGAFYSMLKQANLDTYFNGLQ